ncbi:MAG: CPBP family intramembrane glutamic endopeptidase [Acidobacteriaceae bacterium]|jgi:membrane protease YdiL (CAAX protease family)
MNSSPPGSSLPEAIDGSADAANPAPPLPRFTVFDIFFGPEGLRALWGILLFLAVRRALIYAIYPLVRMLDPSRPNTNGLIQPRLILVHEGAALLCVLIATWLLARIERRPVAAYGFSPRRSLPNFAAGLACGVALLSLLVLMLRAAGLLVFDARLLSGAAALRYGVIWLTGFFFVSLFEESYSRGYLQFTLTRGLSGIYRWFFGVEHANAVAFWIAALILSFAFGFGHRANPGESPLGMLSAGLAGFLFCFSLWRTGSLWWAIGFHASWDWAQSFLYGVPDSGLMAQGHLYATHPVGKPFLSGGLTGPEGSLLLLPVIVAGVAAVLLTLPRTNSGYGPANAPPPSLH